jgi:hypothetical protein
MQIPYGIEIIAKALNSFLKQKTKNTPKEMARFFNGFPPPRSESLDKRHSSIRHQLLQPFATTLMILILLLPMLLFLRQMNVKDQAPCLKRNTSVKALFFLKVANYIWKQPARPLAVLIALVLHLEPKNPIQEDTLLNFGW